MQMEHASLCLLTKQSVFKGKEERKERKERKEEIKKIKHFYG